MNANVGRRVAAAIRDVPDFPVAGVVFKDITPMLGKPTLFRDALDAMAGPFLGASVTHVLAIESRGFLFGSPLALALASGLVLARKPGRLPRKTSQVSYDLEYGADSLEVHSDSLSPGDRVLIVDDVLATGGTAAAAARLVEQLGATPVGICVLIELSFLGGRERLADLPVHHVVSY
jgi:adenine phosphoribosyltransferase